MSTRNTESESSPKTPTFAENAMLMVKLLIAAGVIIGLLWFLSRTN